MEISCQFFKNTLWVKISGELDLNTADAMRLKLGSALDKSGARHMVCDFTHVTFIDSSGLGVLLGRYRQLAAVGGSISINNVNPQVYKLLEFSGLNKIIRIEKPLPLRARKS